MLICIRVVLNVCTVLEHHDMSSQDMARCQICHVKYVEQKKKNSIFSFATRVLPTTSKQHLTERERYSNIMCSPAQGSYLWLQSNNERERERFKRTIQSTESPECQSARTLIGCQRSPNPAWLASRDPLQQRTVPDQSTTLTSWYGLSVLTLGLLLWLNHSIIHLSINCPNKMKKKRQTNKYFAYY